MKTLQEFADFLNGCIQCGKCKHLAYVEDADYMECSLGIEGNTKGKCEKFEKAEDGSKLYTPDVVKAYLKDIEVGE